VFAQKADSCLEKAKHTKIQSGFQDENSKKQDIENFRRYALQESGAVRFKKRRWTTYP
jgi:pyruvate-formate lyase